jgi:putative glutamine amidotransferase
VEAVSAERVIEGLRYNDDTQFIVGVQWHAEWQPAEHALSAALYSAFGEAARKRAQQRLKPTIA